jgi:hypothetical protein
MDVSSRQMARSNGEKPPKLSLLLTSTPGNIAHKSADLPSASRSVLTKCLSSCSGFCRLCTV